MILNLKEGWLTLDMIYNDGEEKWIFSDTTPSRYGEYWDGKTNTWLPGKTKRIMYVEVVDE